VLLPFRDDNPTRRFPIMTLIIIGANIAVFLYMASLAGQGTSQYNAFVHQWSVTPAAFVRHPIEPIAWVTVFSAMFMHGGLLHIGGNLLYLWIFGNNIEDIMGSGRFLVFYLLCGVVATAAHIWVTLTFDSGNAAVPTLGASGAIAGVLGAYLLRFPTAKVETCVFFIIVTVIRLPAIIVLGGWFLLQLGSGVGALGGSEAAGGGVAYWAHIGGFLMGILLVSLFARRAETRYDDRG
jgi:membrane associated rhomboid family serine protease